MRESAHLSRGILHSMTGSRSGTPLPDSEDVAADRYIPGRGLVVRLDMFLLGSCASGAHATGLLLTGWIAGSGQALHSDRSTHRIAQGRGTNSICTSRQLRRKRQLPLSINRDDLEVRRCGCACDQGRVLPTAHYCSIASGRGGERSTSIWRNTTCLAGSGHALVHRGGGIRAHWTEESVSIAGRELERRRKPSI